MERITKRRRTVAVESWQRTTITATRLGKSVWCENLSAECSALEAIHFAEMVGVDPSEVPQLIKAGSVHVIETSGQTLTICSCSFRKII